MTYRDRVSSKYLKIISFVLVSISMLLIPEIGISQESNKDEKVAEKVDEKVDKKLLKKQLKDVERIRKSITRKDFQKAAERSIAFLDEEEAGKDMTKFAPSDFYKEVYNCLCVSATGLGQVQYAMDACNTSLLLNKNHWETLKSRATLYYLTADYPNALQDFQSALTNAPDERKIKNALKQNIAVVESKIE